MRLADPTGFAVEVIHGLQDLPRLPSRPPRIMNLPDEKRRVNAPQPALVGPAEVYRLGHAVMQRQEFARNANWYVQNFGLIASDVLLLPGTREPVLAFMRCDRGDDPADHHTVVIALGPEDGYEHAAFELQDLDALGAGSEWLQRQGWVKAWGIGRHVLGSQLFSYHYDPSGFTVEHYADGDVFGADIPDAMARSVEGRPLSVGPGRAGSFRRHEHDPQARRRGRSRPAHAQGFHPEPSACRQARVFREGALVERQPLRKTQSSMKE